MTELSCPDCKSSISIEEELSVEPKDISCPECMSDLRVSIDGDNIRVRSIEEAELLGVIKKNKNYSDSAYGEYD